MKIFATRLRELRQEKGMTLKQVSSELCMPLMTYANYEQEKRQPSLETLSLLCSFYDVSADYLIGRTDNY
jgi:transcriptional regulator with XRE-family HTH domain